MRISDWSSDVCSSDLRFKALADAKKHVYDEDIIALVDDEVLRGHDGIQVKEVEIYCGSNGPQRAILTLDVDGEEKTVTSRGNGPVGAQFNAIRVIVPHDTSGLAIGRAQWRERVCRYGELQVVDVSV